MTATIITIEPRVFPFTSLSQVEQERSLVPRGEVIFTTFDEAITAGGAGGQEVIINMTPPFNFAYAIVDCSLRIGAASTADINDWNNEAPGTIIENRGANRFLTMPFEGENKGVHLSIGIAFTRDYTFKVLPKALFEPNVDTTSPVSLAVANSVAGGLAATADVFVRLLQYDISQKHHFAVNTPIPVR